MSFQRFAKGNADNLLARMSDVEITQYMKHSDVKKILLERTCEVSGFLNGNRSDNGQGYSTSRCYEVQEPHPQPPPISKVYHQKFILFFPPQRGVRGGGLRCT